jgi:hypothetical protein
MGAIRVTLKAVICRFCGQELTVEFDDEYARHGDEFGLLRFVACNRCTDETKRANQPRRAVQKPETAASIRDYRATHPDP